MVQRLSQAERREQTRRRLLDSARQVFGAKGFAGASLDEIAEEAGLTRGALYYNFPGGKDDLFLALLDERADERAAAIEQAFSGGNGGSLEETLRRTREAAGDFARNLSFNRQWHQLFFEFALHASREPGFGGRFRERETSIRKAIATVIEDRAARLGAEPAVSPDHLALGIIALGNGLALENAVEETNVPHGLFEELVGLLVLGLAAAARGPSDNGRGGSKQ